MDDLSTTQYQSSRGDQGTPAILDLQKKTLEMMTTVPALAFLFAGGATFFGFHDAAPWVAAALASAASSAGGAVVLLRLIPVIQRG